MTWGKDPRVLEKIVPFRQVAEAVPKPKKKAPAPAQKPNQVPAPSAGSGDGKKIADDEG